MHVPAQGQRFVQLLKYGVFGKLVYIGVKTMVWVLMKISSVEIKFTGSKIADASCDRIPKTSRWTPEMRRDIKLKKETSTRHGWLVRLLRQDLLLKRLWRQKPGCWRSLMRPWNSWCRMNSVAPLPLGVQCGRGTADLN